jgi:hypothetical protein
MVLVVVQVAFACLDFGTDIAQVDDDDDDDDDDKD